MQKTAQIAVTKRLFEYIDQRTTAMADTVYAQPVVEYTCPNIAAREQQALFQRAPLCVGMSSLLPAPGTYFTHELSGQPLLLTRDDDGVAQAFLNVCRHRGARVAEGCGRRRSFVCPYHAWAYGLDGRLVARPEEHAFRAVPRADHGLVRVPVAERDGLLWVVASAAGELDLDRHLAGLGEELSGFKLAGFHHYKSHTLHQRMNWKLLVDTFLESYHFCVLHKDSICSIFTTT